MCFVPRWVPPISAHTSRPPSSLLSDHFFGLLNIACRTSVASGLARFLAYFISPLLSNLLGRHLVGILHFGFFDL